MSYESISVSLVSTIAQNDRHKEVETSSTDSKAAKREIKQRTNRITSRKSIATDNSETKSKSKAQNIAQKPANTKKEIKSKSTLEENRLPASSEQIEKVSQIKTENNLVATQNSTYLIAPPPVKEPERPLESETSNRNSTSSLADKVGVKSKEGEKDIELEEAISAQGEYQPPAVTLQGSPQSLPMPEVTEALNSSEKPEKTNATQLEKPKLAVQKMETSKKEPSIRINENRAVYDQENESRKDENHKESITPDSSVEVKTFIEPVSQVKTKRSMVKAVQSSAENNLAGGGPPLEHPDGQDKSGKVIQDDDRISNNKGLQTAGNAVEPKSTLPEDKGALLNFSEDVRGAGDVLATEMATFPLKTNEIVSEYSPKPSNQAANDKSPGEREALNDKEPLILSEKKQELKEVDGTSNAATIPQMLTVQVPSDLPSDNLTLQENKVLPEDNISNKEEELIPSPQVNVLQKEKGAQKIDSNDKAEESSLTESLTLSATINAEKPTVLAKDNRPVNTPKEGLVIIERESNDLDERPINSFEEKTQKTENLKISDRHAENDNNIEIIKEPEHEITDSISMVATSNDLLVKNVPKEKANGREMSGPPLVSDKVDISLDDEKASELITMESVPSDKRDSASVANLIAAPESSNEDSIILEVQTSKTNRTPSRESYQLLVDSNLTLAQTKVEEEKTPKEKEAVLPIDILNDIEAEVYVKEMGDKIVFSLERRPHPMESRHSRTRGEHVDLQITEKYGEPGNERVTTYVERADKGVYSLKIKNTSQGPFNLSVNLRLYRGREAEKQYDLQGIRLSASGEIDIKFLMPEAVFWDEKGYFTGEIENSGYITRFNAETGLVWKEKKRF